MQNFELKVIIYDQSSLLQDIMYVQNCIVSTGYCLLRHQQLAIQKINLNITAKIIGKGSSVGYTQISLSSCLKQLCVLWGTSACPLPWIPGGKNEAILNEWHSVSFSPKPFSGTRRDGRCMIYFLKAFNSYLFLHKLGIKALR